MRIPIPVCAFPVSGVCPGTVLGGSRRNFDLHLKSEFAFVIQKDLSVEDIQFMLLFEKNAET